jgi:hypothetical protein
MGRQVAESAVECPDRRARRAHDDDVVFHLKSPVIPAVWRCGSGAPLPKFVIPSQDPLTTNFGSKEALASI